MAKRTKRELEGDVLLAERTKLQEPPRYRVILHNDDVTTMNFVVQILCLIFHKSVEEATKIMMLVHTQGRGVCGVFPLEIAESKVHAVRSQAILAGFPLKCTMEKE
ncbi:MAG: ATP-dependent Clp protease adaptor ClpS [Desulfovibrionaceae bacterium]|nr:ATP-dependent Clp protease adaptor ClpS [Desulfovibrionaceae bacterium]